MGNNYIEIISSKTDDFALVFDGYNNDYYILYDNEEIKKVNEGISPKDLWESIKLENFDKILTKDDLNPTLKALLDEITMRETKKGVQQRIFNDLLRNLADYYKHPDEYLKSWDSASSDHLSFLTKLSEHYGCNTEVFEDLLIPADIEEQIQQRTKPVLTNEETAKTKEIAEQINEKGLLPYLDDILKDIHLGEHKNIYRKTLMLFKIMRGEASFISETTAKAEAGKSFEDDIVFKLIAPQRYIFKANDITEASLKRYGAISEYYFDRQIILFGDLGSKQSFNKVEPVFNIIKPLITENEYDSHKSDKNDDLKNIILHLKVDSIGAVYSTVENSFTNDDNQLISRTLYSTPANVDDLEIMNHVFYLSYSKSKQSKAKEKAEEKLKDFGLYLLEMVNKDIEIINPYIDVFIEYSLQSDSPRRELKQQLQLFDAYCILTYDKCKEESKGSLFASMEQLKEYMDFINLETALIPIEYDFLKMLKAEGKANELTILYNEYELKDEDIELDGMTTLLECENNVIELFNDNYAETKADLTVEQIKNIPHKLISLYGIRKRGEKHKDKIFFRLTDLKIYNKYNAYKNVDNVAQMLQTLYNKGYLGKYDQKYGKENIYYLTPLCNDLNKKFEPKKSYDEYVTEFIQNVGYENL